ncbi:OST-HTH/LOTUS domain [Trinorchestia longiramus]|nr:OST-HTH/LOTUS domain [Trinorchestia longiramus]
MYMMRDIVTVSDNSTGRMIALQPRYRHVPLALPSPTGHPEQEGVQRFCQIHSLGLDNSIGWAERDNTVCLPNVTTSLKVFAETIPKLLNAHDGFLPLASLVECYSAVIGRIDEVSEGGVPLEHLVSCLPTVSIKTNPNGSKFIMWSTSKTPHDDMEDLIRFVCPPLVGQLALLSRELVDLLKTFPNTRLPFSRFIPAYHHHFGRQCRVADYGFTKLAELFDALANVVQVLGEGSKRVITLAHRAQIRRFSCDLVRVLKSCPSKCVLLEQLPVNFKKVMCKPFAITDYGVNDIFDILDEISEATIEVVETNGVVSIGIPVREQTQDEYEKTLQFGAEVIELLRHSPECKMQFNRFIPAYHHHFGRQCKVADYGFTKLVELFEAIPDVLEIYDDEEDGDKQLQLVETERLRVLGEQVTDLFGSEETEAQCS